MTVFEFLTENHTVINTLTKCGIISISTPTHYAVYSRFKHLRDRGKSKTDSYIFVADEFRISDNMVYRIVKKMESSI